MPPSAPGDQITQLYWDWTSPLQTARLWQDESIGGDGFGECVTDGPFAHAAGKWNITVAENLVLPFGTPGVQSASCLVRQFSVHGTLPSSNNVEQALQVAAYDSWPFDKNAFGSISFRNVCTSRYSSFDHHTSISHQSIHNLSIYLGARGLGRAVQRRTKSRSPRPIVAYAQPGSRLDRRHNVVHGKPQRPGVFLRPRQMRW